MSSESTTDQERDNLMSTKQQARRLGTIDHLVMYKTQQLDEATTAAFEAHLADCTVCQAFLKNFEVILLTYQKLPQAKAKGLLADYVMARMPAELVKRLNHLEKLLELRV